jgi:hypothetical protein
VQCDFLKYNVQKIKANLKRTKAHLLNELRVDDKDRKYQVRERNPLSVAIWTEDVLLQKPNYIHNNLVRAGLCEMPRDYKYSSAEFYETGKDSFGFLHHYRW